MAATFDLDAARAARAEKRGGNPIVVVDGVPWELIPEIPVDVVEGLDDGSVRDAIEALVVGPAATDDGDAPDDDLEFPTGTFTMEDVLALTMEVYQFGKLGPTS